MLFKMYTKNTANTEEIISKFYQIFDNKGTVIPFADKANQTCKKLKSNPHKFYYFAIGFQIKNLDKKQLFRYKDELDCTSATQFKMLDIPVFVNLINDISTYIDAIRNINAHYIHTFDSVNLKQSNDIKRFIKQAFLCSVISNYALEKKTTIEKALKSEEAVVKYLSSIFLHHKNTTDKQKDRFNALSLSEAIEEILFIKVEQNIEWTDSSEQSIFNIPIGTYPSYWAILLLVAIFNYKNDTTRLISATKGLKRTDSSGLPKREIFSFFSKKFSSQDYNSNLRHLVKFRDLINYLNKYPTSWKNRKINETQELSTQLYKYIIKGEIANLFPAYLDEKDESEFTSYSNFIAQKVLGLSTARSFGFQESTTYNKQYEYNYRYSPKQQTDISSKKIKIQKSKYNLEKLEQDLSNLLKKENKNIELLKQRVSEGISWTIYGRNQDRFMLFAARFLAENNYFGQDSRFKVYLFSNNLDQINYIESLKAELKKTKEQSVYQLKKKEIDNLKYHDGRIVEFQSYTEIQSKDQEYDLPFVVANNAIQIELPDSKVILNIQRELMPYILEDSIWFALNKSSKRSKLVDDYRTYYEHDFSRSMEQLEKDNSNGLDENILKRIIPKRLLQQYIPKNTTQPSTNSFRLLIKKANDAELRYNERLKESIEAGNYEVFINRNKGKKHKLNFIYKSWNIMFFKNIYIEKLDDTKGKHHKDYHFTREEYQDFSKWMYAFEDYPFTKEHLVSLLTRKGFLNSDIDHMLKSSTTLGELFQQSLDLFTAWSKENSPKNRPNQKLKSYRDILENNMWYINLSHFRNFIINQRKDKVVKGTSKIKFTSLDIADKLIPEYYEKYLNPNTNKKLFNQLKSTRLEDSLLYNIAFIYLNENIKENRTLSYTIQQNRIEYLLRSNVKINIHQKGGKAILFSINTPFKKLQDFLGTSNFAYSQYIDISDYINCNPDFDKSKDLEKNIYYSLRKSKEITYDQLQYTVSIILGSLLKLSTTMMELERYLILDKYLPQNKNILESSVNRITLNDLKDFDKDPRIIDEEFRIMRNTALHLKVPKTSILNYLKELERIIIKELQDNIDSWGNIPSSIEPLLYYFLTKFHSNLYKKVKGEKQEISIDKMKEKYIQNIINKE